MKSIRQYLKRRIIFGVIPILAICNLSLALIIRNLDIAEFDEALEVKAQTLATLLFYDENGPHVNVQDEYMPEFSKRESGEFYQLARLDGTILERSQNLQDERLPVFPMHLDVHKFVNTRLAGKRRIRMVQMVFTVPPQYELVATGALAGTEEAKILLGVAYSRKDLDYLLYYMYTLLTVTSLAIFALLYFWIERTLTKGIAPIARLNDQLKNIHPGTLEKRVRLPQVPEELHLTTRALNELLESLHRAFQREQRFSSDVAHELRTPVAEMRLACEIGTKWMNDSAMVQRRFSEIQESAQQMEAKVNALLALGRLERERKGMRQLEGFPLAAGVEENWRKLTHIRNPLNLRLKSSLPENLSVQTDPTKLNMILTNLLENALAYSRTDSTVSITGGTDAYNRPWLAIQNKPAHLEEEDVPHLFERFWRKDAARTDGHHAGLGLSIVQALAGLLDIQLETSLDTEDDFSIRMTFPN